MNKNDIIKYAAIAGGLYAVYWYLNNYGPTGAVSAGSVSYWSSWFGGTAAAPVVTQPTGPVNQPPAQPVVTQPTGPITAPTNTGQAPKFSKYAALREAILQAAGITDADAAQGRALSADQWNYYQNIVNPPALTGTQFGQVVGTLPASGYGSRGSMTIDQFMTALQSSGVFSGLSGVGDVVPSYSVPSVPMMSFGGNAFSQPFGPGGFGGGFKN
jgi:hypothetical protein